MKIISLLKTYSFHIFVVITFVFFTAYKFYPNLFNFNKFNQTDISDICFDYVKNNQEVYDTFINNQNTLQQGSSIDQQDVLVGEGDIKESQSDATLKIHVDLSGAVKKPGVYLLNKGDRIKDLINLGEGFTQSASSLWISRNLNLSSLLFDTQKVYVPFKWETYGNCSCVIDELFVPAPLIENYSSNNSDYALNNKSNSNSTVQGTSSSNTDSVSTSGSTQNNNANNTDVQGTGDDQKINVNNSSLQTLQTLNGIGPSYAQKIVDNRPYTDLQQFTQNSGVPASTIQKVSDYITF